LVHHAPNTLAVRDQRSRARDRCYFRDELAEPQAVLVAEIDGSLIGFAELSIRAYAEGCHSRGVAYLESWYVVPEHRGRGVGALLIIAAEDWGRAQGCSEFASDAEPGNDTSKAAHLATGFEEVGLIRCFRKALDPPEQ
jgi:aminoglycoside 6'-N-acetyltransferase I